MANKHGHKVGVRVSGVPCKECGAYCDYLPTHLRYAHGMEMDDYIAKHPEVKDKGLNTIDIPKTQRTQDEITADLILGRHGRPYLGTVPSLVKRSKKTEKPGIRVSNGRGED